MLNVFNLLQWCFDLLIPARSRQFGRFVNPHGNPHQGFIRSGTETLAEPKGFPITEGGFGFTKNW